MITLNELERHFPDDIENPGKMSQMLKEALQYKVLEEIYNSKFSNDLVFMGGTCLRILYDFKRFSEDLDFDIVSGTFSETQHNELLKMLSKRFGKEGYECSYSIKKTHKGVFTGVLDFSGLENKIGIKADPRRKLKIKIDAQPQGYNYNADKKIINKFGVYALIQTMPAEMILASKLYTLTQRVKGRDMYDVVELSSFTKANSQFINFLFEKKGIKITSYNQLKEKILENLKTEDIKEKISEIKMFLFSKKESARVELFQQWIVQLDINKVIN